MDREGRAVAADARGVYEAEGPYRMSTGFTWVAHQRSEYDCDYRI